VIVSVFVNPTQFGPEEDLERYPRQVEEDLRAASEAGADLVFAPSRDDVYAEGHRTWVTVEGLSEVLCGARRPGHFRGVTTIVAKLLNLVRPDVAFFGRKDYQQSVVIRRMVEDLDFGVEIRVLPTVREEDGLALSSRNAYLLPEEREKATQVIRALRAAQAAFAEGERRGSELAAVARAVFEGTEGLEPEYAVVVHPDTLEPVETADERSVALAAVRLGKTRLIDNVILGERE
jgi:pantoate--beta-alanine ligase